jgi:hypothetical protein
MTSIFSIYEYFLSPEDLKNKEHTVTIQAARVTEVWSDKDKCNHKKIVLSFPGRARVMALNKTQAEAVMTIANTDEIEKWPGTKIGLRQVTLNRVTQTIEIYRPETPQETQADNPEKA